MDDDIAPVKVCELAVMQLIEPDGSTSYAIRRNGEDVPISTWLGLLSLAQNAILHEYNNR